MAAGKKAGKILGDVAGKAVRAGADALSGMTGSQFIADVGVAAEHASYRTGEVLGRAADGVGGAVRGLVEGDDTMTKSGIQEMGGAVVDVAVGTVQSMVNTVELGATVVHGVRKGDHETARLAGRSLAIGNIAGEVAPLGDHGRITDTGSTTGQVRTTDSGCSTQEETDPIRRRFTFD